MMQQKIYYRKVRDLGGVFTASFSFLKHNFKPFFGSIMLFAGPFLLISSTISSVAMSSFGLFSFLPGAGISRFNYSKFFLAYFISMLIMMAGLSVYNVVLNKTVIDQENLEPEQPLTLKVVASGFFGHYWRTLANMILLLIAIAVASFFLVLVLGGVGAVISGFFALGAGIGVVFVLLFIALLVILMPMLSYVPLAAIFVCQRDNINIFSAIGKVFAYMRDNFWNTWAVSFIALMVYSVLSFIVQLPALILYFITAFSRASSPMGYGVSEGSNPLLVTVITVVCSLLGFGVLSVYYLMCIYQYGSLEEKHEGTRVLEKIQNIE